MLVALPLVVGAECLMPGVKNLLGPLEGFRRDDLQLGLVHHDPVILGLVRPLAGEKVADLLLAIDYLAGVQLVGDDAADGVLAPGAVALGAQAALVEGVGDFSGSGTFLGVHMENLADDFCLILVDGKVEIVADGLVVAEDDVGDPALLGVHLLAELDTLGGVGTLLLGQRAEDGQHKLAVAHAGHVGGEKLGLDAQGFQLADALEQVDGVPGETANVLDHHHVKQVVLGIGHHAQEFLAVLDLCAGDALVGVEAHKHVAGAAGVF